MATLGSINPATGKPFDDKFELDKFNKQQARLNSASSAVKNPNTADTTFEDRYAKQQANKAAEAAAAQAKRQAEAQAKAEVKGLMSEGQQQTYDAAVDLFGETYARNNVPRTIEEVIQKQIADREALFNEQKAAVLEQNKLEDRSLQMANESTQASKAGVRASLAQGREGVISQGNIMASDKAQSVMQKRYDLNADQVRSAQEARFRALENQKKAMNEGKVELAAIYGNQAAAAETRIRESKAALLEAEAKSLSEASAFLNTESQIATRKAETMQQGFKQATGMIDSGIKLDSAGLMALATSTGVPVGDLITYYNSDNPGREALIAESQRKAQGIVNADLEKYDFLQKMYKNGASHEDIVMFKRVNGIQDEDDPAYVAKVQLDQALAKQALAAASGAPIEGTKQWYENKINDLEIAAKQAELYEKYGIGAPPVDSQAFDTYVSSLGTITQTPDTPTNYIKGRSTHGGYDIAGKKGSNIPAFVAGTVVETGRGNTGWGNYVIIEDAQGNKHRYAHLQDIGANKGDIITAGGSVGTMGNSGNVFGETGMHLHYEVKDSKGNLIDPKSLVGSGGGKAQKIAEAIFNGGSALTLKDLPVKERSKVDMELNKLKEQAMASGDAVGAMRASAGGDKPSDAFRTQIGKTAATINQLGALSAALNKKKINDPSGNEVDISPITGWLKKKNPWSQEGQELNAMMQATIPNLARGVYGEVGVLTDQDVELYKKTLPNLAQPEEIRKSVTAITLRSVRNSLRDNLVLAAGSGTDVSGLVNYYQELDNKVKQMESDLGIVEDNTPDVANNPWAAIDTTPDITVGEEDYTPDDIASLFDSVIKKR